MARIVARSACAAEAVMVPAKKPLLSMHFTTFQARRFNHDKAPVYVTSATHALLGPMVTRLRMPSHTQRPPSVNLPPFRTLCTHPDVRRPSATDTSSAPHQRPLWLKVRIDDGPVCSFKHNARSFTALDLWDALSKDSAFNKKLNNLAVDRCAIWVLRPTERRYEDAAGAKKLEGLATLGEVASEHTQVVGVDAYTMIHIVSLSTHPRPSVNTPTNTATKELHLLSSLASQEAQLFLTALKAATMKHVRDELQKLPDASLSVNAEAISGAKLLVAPPHISWRDETGATKAPNVIFLREIALKYASHVFDVPSMYDTDGTRALCLSGTPGTGKTYFAQALVWMAFKGIHPSGVPLTTGPLRVVYMFPQSRVKPTPWYYLIHGDSIVATKECGLAAAFMRQDPKKTICIADSVPPLYGHMPDILQYVQVSAPDPAVTQRFCYDKLAIPQYLPTWNEDELKAFSFLCARRTSGHVRGLDIAGGIPRYLFTNRTDEPHLQKFFRFDYLSQESVFDAVQRIRYHDNVPHFGHHIWHIKAVDAHFSVSEISTASDFIEQQLRAQKDLLSDADRVRLIRTFERMPELAAALGHLLQAHARILFRKGITLERRDLRTGAVDTFEVPAMTATNFADLQDFWDQIPHFKEGMSARMFWPGTSNVAGVDAFTTNAIWQFTTRRQQPSSLVSYQSRKGKPTGLAAVEAAVSALTAPITPAYTDAQAFLQMSETPVPFQAIYFAQTPWYYDSFKYKAVDIQPPFDERYKDIPQYAMKLPVES